MNLPRYCKALGVSAALFIATAAGARTPGLDLDAGGIALGATEAEVVAFIESTPHLQPFNPDSLAGRFNRPDLPAPLFNWRHISAQDRRENIHVHFTVRPADPSTVWKIMRGVSYPTGQEPSLDVVLASLREKYGDTPALTDQGGNRLFWVYDADGHQVTGKPGEDLLRNCMANGLEGFDTSPSDRGFDHRFLGMVNHPPERVRVAPPAECVRHRFARAHLQVNYGTPLVREIDVVLVDTPRGLPALAATFEMLDQLTESARQQRIQESQGIQPRL